MDDPTGRHQSQVIFVGAPLADMYVDAYDWLFLMYLYLPYLMLSIVCFMITTSWKVLA